MIKIFRDRSANRLTVSGHAGAAPAGEDVICAAVTALAATLACNVRTLEERGTVSKIHEEMENGIADISCKPAEGYDALVCVIYDTICMGFVELAKDHPDCVEYHSK